MALEKNDSLGSGGSGFHGQGPGTASRMIRELQGLRCFIVAGAGADTDMTVSGIKTNDTLLSVLMFASGVPSDVTADASITDTDTIQVSSDTSGNTVQVWYYSKPE